MDQDRLEFINGKVRASTKKGLLSAWPRAEKELPLVELEVDWVRLSTLNHRTKAEQRREIHKTGQLNLFTEDPLGALAQKVQCSILCQQEGFGDLKNDLAERSQQDHAIVTSDGILINGNRRACALRSLLHDDNNLSCRYIRCLVLPVDSTSPEIFQLETELQVARDFKQEYSWINQALLIEELYEESDRNFGHVAHLMHRKEKEIRDEYEKIQQVNQLVALSKGRWLHVDFEPNESAFNELALHIRNKDEEEKAGVRSVYFLGTLAGVNYRDLRKLRRPDAEDLVIDELSSGDAQLSEIVTLAQSSVGGKSSADDLLDDVLGEAGESSTVRSVLEFVAGLDREGPVKLPSGQKVEVVDVLDQLGRAVKKAADEAHEQQRDEDAARAPILRLEKALSELTRARDSLPAARAVPGWDEAGYSTILNEVESIVMQLKGAS